MKLIECEVRKMVTGVAARVSDLLRIAIGVGRLFAREVVLVHRACDQRTLFGEGA